MVAAAGDFELAEETSEARCHYRELDFYCILISSLRRQSSADALTRRDVLRVKRRWERLVLLFRMRELQLPVRKASSLALLEMRGKFLTFAVRVP